MDTDTPMERLYGGNRRYICAAPRKVKVKFEKSYAQVPLVYDSQNVSDISKQ